MSSCPRFDIDEGISENVRIVEQTAALHHVAGHTAALHHVAGHTSVSEADPQALSKRRLGGELQYIPVMSEDTGIVYINQSVFTCNAAREEKPNKWRLVAKVKQGIWSPQDLVGAIDLDHVYYMPQQTRGRELNSPGFPYCVPHSIESCPNNSTVAVSGFPQCKYNFELSTGNSMAGNWLRV